jgi:hypothetical protein
VLFAQHAQKPPFQASSTSQIDYHVSTDHDEVVAIHNVEYELTGAGIPGRGFDDRLVLRKTVHTLYTVGDIGMEAKTTVEAWPLGVNLKQQPVYSISAEGTEPRTVNSDLIMITRGVEDDESSWSVYQLGTGKHLFDTDVPLVQLSIARETLKLRYVGLEVAVDDAADKRLKTPNAVALLTYASGEKIIREALVTCDDPKRAILLRSVADSARTVTGDGKSIRLTISQNYPSPPATVSINIPIAGDDLDVAHVQAPVGVHVTASKR